MNLRVDLILPTERRSASGISLKTIYRVGSIVLPLILLAVGAYIAMQMINMNNKLKEVERTWRQTEPRKEQAMRVLKQARENDALLDEFEGWKQARVDWNAQLASIQAAVKPNLVFAKMQLGQALGSNRKKGTARNYRMTITGRASGENAESAVQHLKDHAAQSEAMEPLVETVDIVRYSADPAVPADRLFQIDIVYKPREFKP